MPTGCRLKVTIVSQEVSELILQNGQQLRASDEGGWGGAEGGMPPTRLQNNRAFLISFVVILKISLGPPTFQPVSVSMR